MKQVNLVSPRLGHQNLVRCVTQLRPYRRQGIRLESQQIGSKKIFHNYGHGGAGISLAYGSAVDCCELVTKNHGRPADAFKVAVLGSGVIGLNTAIELRKKGFTVNIYSERFPSKKDMPEQVLASQVAAGKWGPTGYDHRADKQRHQRLSKISFDYYVEAMKSGLYKSIKLVKVYDNKNSVETLKQVNTADTIKDYNPVQVKFSTGTSSQMTEYTTIRINCQEYLQELTRTAKQIGVGFATRRFTNLNDVMELEQPYIVNCTGLGSKKLFKDNNMQGVRGHLLYFKNTEQIDYMLMALHKSEPVSIYAIDDLVAVGFSYIEDQTTSQQLDLRQFCRIHLNALQFFGMIADAKL